MSTSDYGEQLDQVIERMAQVDGLPRITEYRLTTSASSIEVELAAVVHRKVMIDSHWNREYTTDEMAAALAADFGKAMGAAAAQMSGLGLVRPQLWANRGSGLIVTAGPKVQAVGLANHLGTVVGHD